MVNRVLVVACSFALAGCGAVAPSTGEPVFALVVTNGRADEAVLVVEQTGGELLRIPYQACSAHSEPLAKPWHLEVDAIVAVSSEDLSVIDGAPFTVVRVDLLPDGIVRIGEPEPAAVMPDAPIRFVCDGGNVEGET